MVAPIIVGFCNVDEKLFGPLHAYVAPVIVLAVKLKVEPEQIELLLPAVGARGVWLIVTEVVASGPKQLFTVTLTVYDPAASVVTLGIIGFCNAEEKPFGPVQEYVAPATVLAVKLNVFPEHTTELLPGVRADGV